MKTPVGVTSFALSWRTAASVLAGLVVFVALFMLARREDTYLLFHSLAEIFSIVVAAGVFMFAWNVRRFQISNFLLLVGVAYLFVAALTILHMLTFPGMGVLAGADANLPTQLWIATRYVQALAMLVGTFVIGRGLNVGYAFAAFGAISTALLAAIFLGWFPDCYLAGQGITGFKIVSEYAICGALISSFALLLRKRKAFDREVLLLILLAITATILSELCFTSYRRVDDFWNAAGHFLGIVAFYLIYKAIVVIGLLRPQALLFGDLMSALESLENSEKRFRMVAQTAHDAIISLDPSGRVVVWNSGAERMFGYTSAEMMGEQLTRVMPARFASAHAAAMSRAASGEHKPVPRIVEVSGLRKDGSEFPMELSVAHWKTGEGMFSVGIARDITQRKAAGEAMQKLTSELEIRVRERTADLHNTLESLRKEVSTRRELEAARLKLAEIVESSDEGIISETFDGKVLSWNRGAERIYGYSAQEMIGRSMMLLVPREHREETERIFALVQRGERLENAVTRRIHKNGDLITVSISYSPIRDSGGTITGIAVICRDITEQVRLESEVLMTSERERQRIGHDLHDTLGQHLTGIGFLCHALHRKLQQKSMPGADEASAIEKFVSEAVSLTRSLAKGLSPVGMQKDGLMLGLKHLTTSIEEMFRVPCEFRCSQSILVNDISVSSHLYRIAQEALNNAVRHGKARHLWVELAAQDGDIVLSVRDDGTGLPRELPESRGMGLQIMRYRANAIGGSLEIQRAPGGGTVVTCLIKRTQQIQVSPWQHEENGDTIPANPNC